MRPYHTFGYSTDPADSYHNTEHHKRSILKSTSNIKNYLDDKATPSFQDRAKMKDCLQRAWVYNAVSRARTIQNDNRQLYNRICAIESNVPQPRNSSLKPKQLMAQNSTVEYLNLDQRASRLQEINRENERTYKRLVDVQPTVDAFQIFLENEQKEKYKEKIAKYDKNGTKKIDPLLMMAKKSGLGKIPTKCKSKDKSPKTKKLITIKESQAKDTQEQPKPFTADSVIQEEDEGARIFEPKLESILSAYVNLAKTSENDDSEIIVRTANASKDNANTNDEYGNALRFTSSTLIQSKDRRIIDLDSQKNWSKDAGVNSRESTPFNEYSGIKKPTAITAMSYESSRWKQRKVNSSLDGSFYARDTNGSKFIYQRQQPNPLMASTFQNHKTVNSRYHQTTTALPRPPTVVNGDQPKEIQALACSRKVRRTGMTMYGSQMNDALVGHQTQTYGSAGRYRAIFPENSHQAKPMTSNTMFGAATVSDSDDDEASQFHQQ